jgi:hypothetical protein
MDVAIVFAHEPRPGERRVQLGPPAARPEDEIKIV